MTHEASCTKETQLKEMNTAINKRVHWVVFCWAIGIMGVSIGWAFIANASMEKKVQDSNAQYLQIQTQLSQIQTDIIWIKKSIDK